MDLSSQAVSRNARSEKCGCNSGSATNALSSFGVTTKTEEPKKDLSKKGPPCLHVPFLMKLFWMGLDRNSSTRSNLLDWAPSETSRPVPRFVSDLDDEVRSSLTFQE